MWSQGPHLGTLTWDMSTVALLACLITILNKHFLTSYYMGQILKSPQVEGRPRHPSRRSQQELTLST